jgi:SAM-dependent methyltransferase
MKESFRHHSRVEVNWKGGVVMAAPYDAIADWYEEDFLGPRSADGLPISDPFGIDGALCHLLGPGFGDCLEIGCGTGTHASRVRSLGYAPIGVDVSAGMLRHARSRLPIARADGEMLPFPEASFSSVLAVMIHSDVPNYSAIIREASRVLVRGGCFIHIGVHPCFCGGFADRTDSEAIVVRPGYLDGHWTTNSWTDRGLRDKVGAQHIPLPDLLRSFVDVGLDLEDFKEGGSPTPMVLSIKARKM